MARLGRYLWPKSLYGQILLVAALALLVAQLVNAALLLSGTRNRAIAEATTMLVTRVANQIERQQERGLDFAARGERVITQGPRRRRGPPVTTMISDKPLLIDRYEPQPELAARAGEFMAASGVGLSQVTMSTGSIKLLPSELRDPLTRRYMVSRMRRNQAEQLRTAVLMTARTADGRSINAAAFVRPTEAGSMFALILQTLLLYIAVLIPLALVARRIVKPLGRLTERVQRVGIANEIEPMKSEGSADIRQLVDAFNAMQARVSTLLGEKDVMLGAIGHDLKTPLAALRVRIESVDDDAERDKMAATIDEMVSILDDILTLARLGKSGEATQRTDIGALVESIAEEFMHVKLEQPGTRIVADIRPVLLRRALRNLIGNAITYGGSADISLKASTAKAQIIIDDDGPGIPPDLMDAMFESFARAETSRSRSTGGSGLGLTIARAIARSHDGDVRLQNREGGGLRAILELPLT